jgi:hypothetical protein
VWHHLKVSYNLKRRGEKGEKRRRGEERRI